VETKQTITVRSPDFPFPTRIDPIVIEGRPELSYVLVGISLSLPYLEPFLIRTLSEAKRYVEDPELREQIRLLNAQEGQHARLHTRFNKAVGQSFPELAALEQELAADCKRFTATRSLKWRLAYVESLEAFTVAFSQFLFEENVLSDVQPAAVRELFEWHAAEELEHRSVAFDVYEHLYGDYTFRVAVSLYAQWHFLRFVMRAARLMMAHGRAQGRDHGRPAQVGKRVLSLIGQFGRGMLPSVVAAHSSRYRPHTIATSPTADEILMRIAARDTRSAAASAGSTSARAAG
jgi:predicted metal-dependent hydrolase